MFYPGCGPSVFSYIYIHIFFNLFNFFVFFTSPEPSGSSVTGAYQELIKSLDLGAHVGGLQVEQAGQAGWEF